MIDTKYFLKGFKSIKSVGSPAIALGASFVATKLAPNAIAGLPTLLIDLNPFKKYFVSIINHLRIGDQHLDYLIDHLLFQQLLFDLKQEHNLYPQTLDLSLHFAQLR